MRKIFKLKNILRLIAVFIFIIGACKGYDFGDRQIQINTQIVDQFSLIPALFYWFLSFALGMLFIGVAKIIDLLENN